MIKFIIICLIIIIIIYYYYFTSSINKWSDKLKKLENYPQKYPKYITKRFVFQTSLCNSSMNSPYKENFIELDELENLTQNYESFKEHIENSNNKYVTSFYNHSKDTLLIIPIPDENKDYTTIKDFIDNADIIKQKIFWKYVSSKIKEFVKENNKVYVSTHGLNVPYFHLRLCSYPKYYI